MLVVIVPSGSVIPSCSSLPLMIIFSLELCFVYSNIKIVTMASLWFIFPWLTFPNPLF